MPLWLRSLASCLAAGKPQRGDPFQSPGCVALQGRPNPGFARIHNPEALQGRSAERPFSTARPFYPCVVWGEVMPR